MRCSFKVSPLTVDNINNAKENLDWVDLNIFLLYKIQLGSDTSSKT